MSVYVILIQDRHTDVDAEVWADRIKAVARAQELLNEYARDPEDIEIQDIDGWIFHASYSCEGDSITVFEREIR